MLKDGPLLAPDRIGTDSAGPYPPASAAARKDGLLPHEPLDYVTLHLQQGIESHHFRGKRPMPRIAGFQSFRTARRTIRGFEAMLWLRKGFGFAGAWTVCEQNRMLSVCSGLPAANKVSTRGRHSPSCALLQSWRQAPADKGHVIPVKVLAIVKYHHRRMAGACQPNPNRLRTLQSRHHDISRRRTLPPQVSLVMPDHVAAEYASGGRNHYLAPWYLAYAILGLITSGMLPFLMPLMIASTTSEPGRIAYVIGAYNIGLLAAPLLGRLAQRYQLFRPIFFGGFIALTLGLGAATQTSAFSDWVPLALLCGLGAGAVATVAPLFVIGFAPKDEWDARIGWLQSFSGGGQLAGLLISGLIAQGPLAYGFWVAAALSALAILVGHFGLPSIAPARGAPAAAPMAPIDEPFSVRPIDRGPTPPLS